MGDERLGDRASLQRLHVLTEERADVCELRPAATEGVERRLDQVVLDAALARLANLLLEHVDHLAEVGDGVGQSVAERTSVDLVEVAAGSLGLLRVADGLDDLVGDPHGLDDVEQIDQLGVLVVVLARGHLQRTLQRCHGLENELGGVLDGGVDGDGQQKSPAHVFSSH